MPHLDSALASLGRLLSTHGCTISESWATGRSRLLAPTSLVIEQSPALTADRHDRHRPGSNHLAFHVEEPLLSRSRPSRPSGMTGA